MRKMLLLLLALSLLLCAAACKEEPPAELPQPGEKGVAPDISSYDLIVLRRYNGTKEVGEASYIASESAPNAAIWQELVRELNDSVYFPTERAYDDTDYFSMNIYKGTGSSQYSLRFYVNGVCEVELADCNAATGSVDFARVTEYFEILTAN